MKQQKSEKFLNLQNPKGDLTCPLCGKGVLETVKDIIKEDNIEFEGFKCSSCSEEIMDMKQLGELADKYKAKAIT